MSEYKKDNIVYQFICESENGHSSFTQYRNGDIILKVSKFEEEGVEQDGK